MNYKEYLIFSSERLKTVFSRYPRPEMIYGCPCCKGDIETPKTYDEFDKYMFSAISTLGCDDDFKSIIPEIFDIYLNWDTGWLVASKLDYLMANSTNPSPLDTTEIRAVGDWIFAQILVDYISKFDDIVEQSRKDGETWYFNRDRHMLCTEFDTIINGDKKWFGIIWEKLMRTHCCTIYDFFISEEQRDFLLKKIFSWPYHYFEFIYLAKYLESIPDSFIFTDKIFSFLFYIIPERDLKRTDPTWFELKSIVYEELFFLEQDKEVQTLFSTAERKLKNFQKIPISHFSGEYDYQKGGKWSNLEIFHSYD